MLIIKKLQKERSDPRLNSDGQIAHLVRLKQVSWFKVDIFLFTLHFKWCKNGLSVLNGMSCYENIKNKGKWS